MPPFSLSAAGAGDGPDFCLCGLKGDWLGAFFSGGQSDLTTFGSHQSEKLQFCDNLEPWFHWFGVEHFIIEDVEIDRVIRKSSHSCWQLQFPHKYIMFMLTINHLKFIFQFDLFCIKSVSIRFWC